MTANIPVFRPLIEKEEISAAVESLELGWLGMGSYVRQFEDAVASVCNFAPSDDRHVVAVSTGHAALHLSLLMMEVGHGDEVITPSFNNAADFQAIRACGAEPVFVDVQEDTLCINADKIEEQITDKTKCIIAMDYGIFYVTMMRLHRSQDGMVFQFCTMRLIHLDRITKGKQREINIPIPCLASIRSKQ